LQGRNSYAVSRIHLKNQIGVEFEMSITEIDNDLVTFISVDKTYDGNNFVVNDLNFGVKTGEFLSILGPSGSGKTTVLMMLAGFEAPSGGEIRLAGQRLNEQPPHRRDIGMVFQNYALFPHMTVAENVAFPLSVRRISRAEQQTRVQSALAMVELAHLAARRPAQLSGGQQQRVALARALVFQPRLVLMDEPLGALDKRLRETMQFEIKRLHHQLGLTIAYVTHDQSEALTMSDRVAVFSQGHIQQLASPDVLYENPANAFVANFIGENNGLSGSVSELDGDEAALLLPEGKIIIGRASRGLSIGEAAVLALRPERTLVSPEPGEGINRLSGQVDDVSYCGDFRRVEISTAAGQTLVVKVPNTMRHEVPAIGHTVEIGWRFEDCKIVSASSI
jgi:putative spermidine/putrescine transport system ATP-binding protein